MSIIYEFRDMTDVEFKREKEAFNEYDLEFGNFPEEQERFGFVATDNKEFIGASSGLAQKRNNQFH